MQDGENGLGARVDFPILHADFDPGENYPRTNQGSHESGQGQARSLTTIKLVEPTRR